MDLLQHIRDAIRRIGRYINGLDAIIRNLEIIGEAAGNLPEPVRKGEPEIDWRKITGLRNILIHEYFGINLPIVWDVVKNKLDPLDKACRSLLERIIETSDQDSQ